MTGTGRTTAEGASRAAAADTASPARAGASPRVLVDAWDGEAERLLDGIDTLILDCDGVLWTGSKTIENAPEVCSSQG